MPARLRFKKKDDWEDEPPKKVVTIAPAKAALLKQKDHSSRLDGLRGMSWAFAVLKSTRLSASEASKLLAPPGPTGERDSRSKIMYQYLNGLRAPTEGPRGKHGVDVVAAADVLANGERPSWWLAHPLWEMFSPDIEADRLNQLSEMYEDVPPELLPFVFKQDPPDRIRELEQIGLAPSIAAFEDYLYVCCHFRMAQLEGYWPMTYWLVGYLANQAASLEPVFDYVKEPFLKFIDDFMRPMPEKPRPTKKALQGPRRLPATERGTRSALVYALFGERLRAYYDHDHWLTLLEGATLCSEWLARSERTLPLDERKRLSEISSQLARKVTESLSREAGLFTAHELIESLDPNYLSDIGEALMRECVKAVDAEFGV